MTQSPQIAIVDYGMGNLFSVLNACEAVGLKGVITSSREDIAKAGGVILPGVGAFPDAMAAIKQRDLFDPIKNAALSGKPFFGICLGMQLMMSESHEFAHTEGLGIFPGKVIRFEKPQDQNGKTLKIPEVQWNQISPTRTDQSLARWNNTLLDGLDPGAYMYFVHSYYCMPSEQQPILSTTTYGNVTYCSTLARDNIFACQYHPERSGDTGLVIYRNFARLVNQSHS